MNSRIGKLVALLVGILVFAAACSVSQTTAEPESASVGLGSTQEELFSAGVQDITGDVPPDFVIEYTKDVVRALDELAVTYDYDCDEIMNRFASMLAEAQAAGEDPREVGEVFGAAIGAFSDGPAQRWLMSC